MQFQVKLYLDHRPIDPSDYPRLQIQNATIDRIVNSIVDAQQMQDTQAV